jgi:hypothetical protein
MRTVRLKITVVALVGMLALAGCTRQSEEAVRVGDVSIDNAQIDDTVAELLSRADGTSATPGIDTVAGLRQLAVRLTVFTEVAREYAREQDVTVPEPDYAAAANELQLDPEEPLVRMLAEARVHTDALLQDATARTPTEDEMRAVYDDFVALVGAGAPTYDLVRADLLEWAPYGQALALRDGLMEAAGRYGVTVHPRYQPIEYPLLQAGQNGELTVVSLPLGEQGTGAVRSAG